jgi:CRP/FNR family cyclic AMP-dependent transcriptional regulator
MIPSDLSTLDHNSSQLRAALRESGWGQDVSEAHVDELLEWFGFYAAAPGVVICREGTPGDFIGLIVSGRLRVSKANDFGGERSLGSLGAGMSFGEMAFIDGRLRSASVTAAEETTLLLLSRTEFDRLARERPPLAVELLLQLIRHLSQRLRQSTERSVQRGL